MGRGMGKGVLLGALHELRRRGADRGLGGLGRAGRPLRRRGRKGQRRLLRLPQGACMNLLPVPRTLELTGELVRAPAADPAGWTRRCRRRATSCTSAADAWSWSAADEAGFFYGEATLAQLARLHDGRCRRASVRDHPDLPVRGVMLDISRDKVPTMDSLHGADRPAGLAQGQPGAALLGAHLRLPQPSRRPCRGKPARRRRRSSRSTPTAGRATSSWCPTRTASAT